MPDLQNSCRSHCLFGVKCLRTRFDQLLYASNFFPRKTGANRYTRYVCASSLGVWPTEGLFNKRSSGDFIKLRIRYACAEQQTTQGAHAARHCV
jgi:hypothetical protein